MNEFVLTCCSTADLPKERFEQLKVSYVCFNYTIDGVTYPDDLGQSIPFDEFYRRMAEGAMTSTSQVNMDQYLQFFEPFLSFCKERMFCMLLCPPEFRVRLIPHARQHRFCAKNIPKESFISSILSVHHRGTDL